MIKHDWVEARWIILKTILFSHFEIPIKTGKHGTMKKM
jgi:hypothetical protein